MRTQSLCNPLLIDHLDIGGPFGMSMKSREFVAFDQSRMGFNSKENDREISGDGNNYDFGARIYDSRLGKFLSIDEFSIKRGDLAPYSFAANSPIIAIDMNGDSVYFVVGKRLLAASKEVIMQMPEGKEIFEKYAMDSKRDFYIATGTISSTTEGQNYPLYANIIDKNGIITMLPPDTPPGTFPTEEAFGVVFDGIKVDPSKENILIIIPNSGSPAAAAADILHELEAHNGVDANGQPMNDLKFGNSTRFMGADRKPGGNFKGDFNTPGSIADRLNKELMKLTKSPLYKKIEEKMKKSPTQTPAEEKKLKPKAE